MHLIPVVPHASPEEVTELVSACWMMPLAVRIPGHSLAHLPSETANKLAECEWTFLVGGWSEPILSSLPDSSRVLQIERELGALRNLGVCNFAGYVDSGWEQPLATLFVEAGLPKVFLSWSPPFPIAPIVTDHLGAVVTIIPIGSPIAPVVDDPATVPAGSSPLGKVLSQQAAKRDQPLTDRSWAEALDADPEAALLHPKMLRLASRTKKGTPPEALEWLLAAQSGSWFDVGVDRKAAHAALVAARHRIDLARRRPAGWQRTSKLDWDADGREEIQIENVWLSSVIDPDAGMISYVDHKPSERSISYLPGEPPWHLARGLVGDQPTRLTFGSFELAEDRGRTVVTIAGSGLELTVTVIESTVSFAYRLHPSFPFERIGPELPLMADRKVVRLKVDGGDWIDVAQPLAHSGHRFRLDAGTYRIVIALEQPGDLFLRPAPGGMVAWPNWPALSGEYRLTLEIVA
jgi:hypothetical protein